MQTGCRSKGYSGSGLEVSQQKPAQTSWFRKFSLCVNVTNVDRGHLTLLLVQRLRQTYIYCQIWNLYLTSRCCSGNRNVVTLHFAKLAKLGVTALHPYISKTVSCTKSHWGANIPGIAQIRCRPKGQKLECACGKCTNKTPKMSFLGTIRPWHM